uniref:Uncharacterized protein MANES_10G072000 n=1 Tax=Rhizophora mucronata TaxID=61149 RepID=A0A2P2J7U5_RHIMU
MKLKLKSSLRQ